MLAKQGIYGSNASSDEDIGGWSFRESNILSRYFMWKTEASFPGWYMSHEPYFSREGCRCSILIEKKNVYEIEIPYKISWEQKDNLMCLCILKPY